MDDRTPRRTHLERTLDYWCRVHPFERTGRVYEALGLRPVFALVAGMFGESLPPHSRSAPNGADPSALLRAGAAARYHEIVNLMAVIIYTPLLILTALARQWWLLAYGAALVSTHGACILLERYKRARAEDLRSDTEAVPTRHAAALAAAPAPPPAVLLGPAAGRIFRPRCFETERFYRRIGLGAFRKLVRYVVALGNPIGATSRPSDLGRGGLAAFEGQTRVAEVTHTIGALLHVPFLVVFALQGYVPGVLYVVYMLYLNLGCAVLQRWHRARVWPALQRRKSRQ